MEKAARCGKNILYKFLGLNKLLSSILLGPTSHTQTHTHTTFLLPNVRDTIPCQPQAELSETVSKADSEDYPRH